MEIENILYGYRSAELDWKFFLAVCDRYGEVGSQDLYTYADTQFYLVPEPRFVTGETAQRHPALFTDITTCVPTLVRFDDKVIFFHADTDDNFMLWLLFMRRQGLTGDIRIDTFVKELNGWNQDNEKQARTAQDILNRAQNSEGLHVSVENHVLPEYLNVVFFQKDMHFIDTYGQEVYMYTLGSLSRRESDRLQS